MLQQEEFIIEQDVKTNIMPEIKKVIPGILGFLLRLIFPKMEAKLIERIKILFDVLLNSRS